MDKAFWKLLRGRSTEQLAATRGPDAFLGPRGGFSDGVEDASAAISTFFVPAEARRRALFFAALAGIRTRRDPARPERRGKYGPIEAALRSLRRSGVDLPAHAAWRVD